MNTALNVLFSPGAAFRKLKEKPAWIVPLIVVVLVLLAVTLVGVSKMNYADVKTRTEQAMRDRGMNEDQIQQRLEASDKIMNNPVAKMRNPAGGGPGQHGPGHGHRRPDSDADGPAAGRSKGQFCAGTGGGRARSGGPGSRRRRSAHPALAARRGKHHDQSGAGAERERLPHHFLSRVDIFTVWEIILIAMGLKIVYDLKDNRSYYFLFGLWLVYIALASLMPGAAMKPR